MERIKFLDTLRFVSAASVLFQHLFERQGRFYGDIVKFLSPGVFGVVLFFIVSGFVIPMTAEIDDFDPRKFAIRRLFRIYPLVIFTFIILGFIGFFGFSFPDFTKFHDASWRDWIANLFLIQDYVGAQPLWGVTWTLSLEAAWYTLFAFSLLTLGRNFDDWLAVGVPLAMVSLGILSMFIDQRLPLGRMGMIYAAVLGCRIYRRYSGQITGNRLLADAIIFLMIMTFCNVVSFGYFSHKNMTMNEVVYPWIAAPVIFLAVSNITALRDSNIINNSVVNWLGTVSFSIYLLHPFAVSLSMNIDSDKLSIVFGVLLSLLFSTAAYRLVEIPGQVLGKRVIDTVFRNGARPT